MNPAAAHAGWSVIFERTVHELQGDSWSAFEYGSTPASWRHPLWYGHHGGSGFECFYATDSSADLILRFTFPEGQTLENLRHPRCTGQGATRLPLPYRER